METLRSLGRGSLAILLKILLVVLPVSIALSLAVGSPAALKDAISSSGIYESFVGAVLDKSVREATDENTRKLLSDPGVQNAVKQSFTPEVLRGTTEPVADGVFNWLEGRTPEPVFSIDLSQPRQKLTDNLAAYATKRAETLPPCTLTQLRNLPENPDILSIPCLPPGVNAAQAAEEFAGRVLTSAELIKNPVVTNQTLLGTQSQAFRDSPAPAVYQAFKRSPWLLGVLTILAGLGLVLLHHDRRRGLRAVAVSLAGCGVFLLAGVLLYLFYFRRIGLEGGISVDAVFQEAIIRGFRHAADNLNRIIALIAGGYVLAGLVTLLLLRRGAKPSGNHSSDMPSNSSEPQAKEPNTTIPTSE